MLFLALLAASLPVLFEGTDPSGFTTVPAPGMRMRMNMAMATSAPWVDSNLWRYRREPSQSFLCDVRGKSVTLAMAEAHAAGVKLSLRTAPEQRKDFEAMLAFLKGLPGGPEPRWTNITVTDDGSPQAAEALNMLSRRNLFFQIAPRPDPKAALNLSLNSSVSNPYDFMQEARQKLGDERRLLRLYGSELTVAELRRDGPRVRLMLVNYGTRAVESLRIRVQGQFAAGRVKPYVYSAPPEVTDHLIDGAFTEFTLTSLPVYAVIDL